MRIVPASRTVMEGETIRCHHRHHVRRLPPPGPPFFPVPPLLSHRQILIKPVHVAFSRKRSASIGENIESLTTGLWPFLVCYVSFSSGLKANWLSKLEDAK